MIDLDNFDTISEWITDEQDLNVGASLHDFTETVISEMRAQLEHTLKQLNDPDIVRQTEEMLAEHYIEDWADYAQEILMLSLGEHAEESWVTYTPLNEFIGDEGALYREINGLTLSQQCEITSTFHNHYSNWGYSYCMEFAMECAYRMATEIDQYKVQNFVALRGEDFGDFMKTHTDRRQYTWRNVALYLKHRTN